MRWSEIKFLLGTLSKEQLNDEAQLFDPYYNRVMKIEGMDSLESIFEGKPSGSGPIVLIGSKDRV